MSSELDNELRRELEQLATGPGLPREIASSRGGTVRFADGSEAICLCSDDYLGLAGDPAVVEAVREGASRYGAGAASARSVAGLLTPHVELEQDLADFLETEAAITYASGWNASQSLLDALCDRRTWVISDELNNASLTDGVRMTRAAGKAVYEHGDIRSLERQLDRAPAGSRLLVVTDGVFAGTGALAPIPDLVDLAEARDATLIVDDSHGIGVLGLEGRGIAEHFGLDGRIDVTTGTLGKALGGGGGFVAGSAPLCDLLARRSRNQLHSTALPPPVACGVRAALGEVGANRGRLRRLRANVGRFRSGVSRVGLESMSGESAIVPVAVGSARAAAEFGDRLLREGVFAIGLGPTEIPEAEGMIRAQISAALTDAQIDEATGAFGSVAEAMGLIQPRKRRDH